MTKFAEAFVTIGAQLSNSSFGGVKQKITSQIGAISQSASATLAKGFGGIATGLAGAFAALKGIETVKFGLTLAAEAEQAQVAFETMLGSAAQAKKLLDELKTFAAETPFEFPELRDAARKLIAFGISADDVAVTLRRIGDIASGVGAPVGELSEIYGKIRIGNRVFSEDLNQLTGRGIPIIQELAKQFGVAESEVRKLVEEGRVGFPNIERAFQDLTSEGGKFANMMAKQSTTLAGLWSALTDAIKTQVGKAGEAMVAAFDLKSVVADMTSLAEQADFVSNAVLKIADVMDVVHDAFLFAQVGVIGFFAAIADGVATLLEKAASIPKPLLESLPGGVGPALALLNPAGNAEGARAFADSMTDAGLAKLAEAQKAFADKTPSERAKELAAQMGNVADTTKKAADSMQAVSGGVSEGAKKADDLVKQLRSELDTFGMSEREKKLFEAWNVDGEMDFFPGALIEAEELSRKLDELEEKAKRIKLGEQITEEMQSPAEQYEAKIKELEGLRKSGDITPETFERAKKAEQDRARRAVGVERDPMEELGAKISDLMQLRDVGALTEGAFQRAKAAAEEEANRRMGAPAGQEEERRTSAPGTVGLAESAMKAQMAILGAKDPTQQQMLTATKQTYVAANRTAEYLAKIVNDGVKTKPGPARAS